MEGVPAGSPYDQLLRRTGSGEELLQQLHEPDFVWPEQWQSQIQALIQRRAAIHSSAHCRRGTRAAHLIPCRDIAALVWEKLARAPAAQIAVLPQGPLTIPYLAAAA
jgi:hypothetical protein